MLCLLFFPVCTLNKLFPSLSGLKTLSLGLSGFFFLVTDGGIAGDWWLGGVGFWLEVREGFLEFSWWRTKDLVISPPYRLRVGFFAGDWSLWSSFSDVPWFSAIHRSNQLQPQWGLLGSMNIRVTGLVDFFWVFCLFQWWETKSMAVLFTTSKELNIH